MKRIVLFALMVPLFWGLSVGCGKKEEPLFSVSEEFAYCPVGQNGSGTLPDVLRIESYRITVTAEGEEPVVFSLPGNVDSANLKDIPKGENRTVLVEAVNNRGQVICSRELLGVSIKGGTVIPIAMSLLAVPFVANVSDGNLVTQTRLTFHGYGEPAGAVEIVDIFNGAETVLTDLDTNEELVSPSLASAEFSFKPAVLPLGEHLFRVRDIQTGQQSEVKVTLVQPGRFPGTGICSAGAVSPNRSDTVGRYDPFSEVFEALKK